MKKSLLWMLAILLLNNVVFAAGGSLFKVTATGVPANVSVTLCLNGKGPLSCQNNTLSGLTLTLAPSAANHSYPAVGIKINTPGYNVSGCTPDRNGYCLFAMSDTAPASVYLTPGIATQYWVATNGSDAANGDINHPFLTIAHARDIVRANPNRGVVPIYINIRGGTYRLSSTLTFVQADSGSASARVIYRAAVGEHPIVSGGQRLTGWTLHDLASNIWQAQGTVSSPTMPRQLYVNGVRATRARSANYPNYYTPSSVLGYIYLYTGGPAPISPNDWTNVNAIEAVTVTQWKMMRCPIDHINAISGTLSELVMQTPCWTNANVYPSPWNFQLLSWFENAYQFMTNPGYWYMDPGTQIVYYIPNVGEDLTTADVELPVLDTLITGSGDQNTPISYINFEGLNFNFATWYDPSSNNGYVCDQSGFHLTGGGHTANLIGHDQNVTRTPGNISFIYAQYIIFSNNRFEHLGAAGLDFGTGSKGNIIQYNIFNDISSAGLQLGGVNVEDHHPTFASQITEYNEISNNLVQYIGQEFYDAAGIYIGFTTHSVVSHNDIQNVPWSGIAIGWGWGLLDFNGFPGLPFASPYMWGVFATPSTAHQNQITSNKIQNFLLKLWDGGAIYSTGYQGTSLADGQLIAYNVAMNKRPAAGGNTFYTDGGSRFITLQDNVSLNNPQGYYDFGPCGLPSSFAECFLTNTATYGADRGGCIPYGDLLFTKNYLRDPVTFFNICSNIFTIGYPVNIVSNGNVAVTSASQVPAWILNDAGRQ